MSQNITRDMTSGTPMKLILGFAIPTLFGFLFQQFYNLVDTIIVGRFLGVNALASVGATGSINFMIVGFCIGVCSGFAIPIAHKFGAGDYVGLRKFVANSAMLSVVFSAVMTIAVLLLCGRILTWMRTPADIYDGAYEYIFIIFAGIPVTFLYNMLSGIIRSLGDSKTPLLFLIIASVINIVLDLLFIVEFQMGVAGAAYATVIGQAVSGICCLVFMIKKFEILKIQKEEWKIEPSYMLTLCNMGIPMGLQYSITAIGSVILQSAVNMIGSVAVASVTAASKIGMFFCCPFDALGSTIATYGGQNMGAKKFDRIREGLKVSCILGAIYSLIALVLLFVFGKTLALLFVESSEVVILENIYLFLMINALFYFPLALVNIVRFLIQGLGFSKFAILAGVCEMAARTIIAFILVPIFGYTAVCFSSPAAWVLADLFLIPAYIHVMKKAKKQFGVT